MAWGLGYFGQSHIVVRFMGLRSSKDVPKARLNGMIWMVLAPYGVIFTGFASIAYFADNPLQNPETVLITLSQVLFNPWVAGILLAAIIGHHKYRRLPTSGVLQRNDRGLLQGHDPQERQPARTGLGTVILIALISIYLTRDPETTELGLVSYTWGGFGAAFGPETDDPQRRHRGDGPSALFRSKNWDCMSPRCE